MQGDQSTYSAFAVCLHWLVFALIVTNWSLGLYMVDLALSPHKLKAFSWHKWVGVTVFLLAALRLAWRAGHPAPPLPPHMPAWQRTATAIFHLLLYVLMFAIPLSGWLYSSATGVPTVYFGLLQLPDLVAKNRELAALLRNVHISLNITLFTVVCIHAAAALKHHFVDRDDVLARMLPFVARSTRQRP